MKRGLEQPAIESVLDEIYRSSETDGEVIEAAKRAIAEWNAPPTLAQMSDLAQRAALPVSRELGRLLYVLVRTKRPTCIVEFGSSFGASLIYLAAAVRDVGGGRVIGTEFNVEKVARAHANLERVGLDRYVEIFAGDAQRTLTDVPAPVDFVLLDGWKGLYGPVLDILEPKMVPGALVVSDNLSMLSDDFVSRMRGDSSRYTTITVPHGDGALISMFEG